MMDLLAIVMTIKKIIFLQAEKKDENDPYARFCASA
jgi:hypothetical protein